MADKCLDKSLTSVEGTKICSSDAQLWRLRCYETLYGIFNHEQNNGPDSDMDLVAMHPMEDTFSFSALQNRIDRYDELNIGERFRLSLAEFLELPRHIVIYLFDKASKPRESDKRVIQLMENTGSKAPRERMKI